MIQYAFVSWKNKYSALTFQIQPTKCMTSQDIFSMRKSLFWWSLLLYPAEDKQFEVRDENKLCIFCLYVVLLTSSIYNTCPLAFFFCLKAVVISATASVPELRTGIGLLVIVPVDFVLAAGALFQCEDTPGINRRSLCGGKGKFSRIFILCMLEVCCFKLYIPLVSEALTSANTKIKD